MPTLRAIFFSCGLLAAVWLTGCAAKPVVVTPPVAAPAPLPLWQQPAVLAAITEPTGDPRAVLGDDVSVYLRMDDLATLRQTRDTDPLVAHVWNTLDAMRPPTTWQRAAENLNLDDGQLADRVFGRTVIVIVDRIRRREIPIVMTRTDEAIIDRLPQACAMQPLATDAQLGPYHLYRASGVIYALGTQWLAITEARHVDHLRRVLCAVPSGEAAHANDDAFAALVAQLPAKREALLLARNTRGNKRHALAIVRDGRDAAFHYAGVTPDVAKLDKRYMVGHGMDFSPLPASSLAAASINVIERPRDIPSPVKMMLFPHSFDRHVMGRIEPRVVAFFGGVQARQGDNFPAVGIAIAMRDKRVANDLDRLVVGAHMMASLGKFDVLRLLFGMRKVEHDGGWYRVGDFGKAIAKHVKDTPLADLLKHPSSAGMTHITFGPIGDWYVISSQEAMFRDCLAAAADPEARLTATDDFQLITFDARRERLLVSGLSRVSAMAPILDDAAEFWRLSGMREKQGPYDAPLQWLASAMQHRRALSFQVWREGVDGVRGELRVIGK